MLSFTRNFKIHSYFLFIHILEVILLVSLAFVAYGSLLFLLKLFRSKKVRCNEFSLWFMLPDCHMLDSFVAQLVKTILMIGYGTLGESNQK